jgi:hypothetical protein
MQHYDAEDSKLTKVATAKATARPMSAPTRTPSGGEEGQGDPMRISLDWWAVLAAAVAVVLIKTGLVAGIPW